MSNVVNLVPKNATANEVLEDCKDNFKQVLILGWDENELMSAKSTSSLDIKEIIYMIEVFKSVLITSGHDIG